MTSRRAPRAARVGVAILLVALHAAAEAPDPEADVNTDVEVVGGSRSASARDVTAASTVIRAEELARPGSDARDALARVPGVQTSRTGTSSDLATASIRGASSAQTPVYLAGVRLNDELTGSADLSTIPLWMMDRVEVFRGNAPPDADRLGLGGAIFFEPRLPRGQRTGGGFQVGSFGERAGWLGAMLGKPDAAALVSLRAEQADNDFEYVSDCGLSATSCERRVTRRNADAETRDAWAISRLVVTPDGGRVVAILNAFERERGEAGVGTVETRFSRTRSQRLLAALSSRLPCAPGSGSCELELTTSWLATRSATRDPRLELALGPSALASAGHRAAQALRLRLWSDGGADASFALNQELESLHVESAGAAREVFGRSLSRAAVSGQLPIGSRWSLVGLAAFGCHATSSDGAGAGAGCDIAAPEARVGARFRVVDGFYLVGNLGRYVRVPTLGQLYGIAPRVRGNSELNSEYGYSADLGVKLAARTRGVSVWAESFVFGRFSSDLIAYRRAALGYVRPFNSERARSLGLELASGATLFDHLAGTTSLTLLDARDTSRERTLHYDFLPFQSRLLVNQGLELFAKDPWRSLRLDRAALGADLAYRSSTTADPAGLMVIPERLSVGVYAALTFARERLGVRASVENLFDANNRDLLDRPLPGRSVHVAISSWW